MRESTRKKNERAKAERAAQGRTRHKRKDDPPGQSWCARCRQLLPTEEFASKNNRRNPYCRECYSVYAHERRLRIEYDITLDRYQEMLEQQEGRCAVCSSKPRTRRLAVDHDHATGVIRGLLCTRCNHKVIGAARESAAVLRRAANYLENPPAVTGLPMSSLEEWVDVTIEAALDRLEIEQANADTPYGAVIVKRPGKTDPGRQLVVMEVWQYGAVLLGQHRRLAS